MEQIRLKMFRGEAINPEEVDFLIALEDKSQVYELAGDVRKRYAGDHFSTCSIINAKSGSCEEDCKWCSQSAHHNSDVATYEMVPKEEALKQAINNDKKGVKRFSLVTSGRALSDRIMDGLVAIYKEIQEQTNLDLCASMGLISDAQLSKLHANGVSHYHCNLETSRSFFSTLCSTHSYDEKVAVIKAAHKVGLKVCSGGIIGMGETMKQRVEMAFELRELGVKSVPINILNPVEGTPLEGSEPLSDDEILTTFAIFRLILPDASIRFAGGRNRLRHIQTKAIQSGVNGALVGDLLTTIGSDIDEDMRDFKLAGFDLK